MKLFKFVGLSILTSSLLLASASLTDKATKAGLKAIPADKAALSKLIDPNKTITAEKVELGKKLYFEPRLSKSGSSPVTPVTTLVWAVLTVYLLL